MRYQGRIVEWRDDQGFGFIAPNGGGKKIFLHIKAFKNRSTRPVGNELVTFEITTTAKGQLQAQEVLYVEKSLQRNNVSNRSDSVLLLIPGFVIFLALTVIAGMLPIIVPGLYLLASAITFIAYAFDKSAAIRNRWRIQENTLHLFAVVGGWPGGLLAQRIFHHKSSKQSFQTMFWITVIINCGLLVWLLTAQGLEFLNTILDYV